VEHHGLSLRQSCRLVGLSTSTLHYKSTRQRHDEPLKDAMMRILSEKPYLGLPRIVERLRDRLGYPDNHKRIGRIYRACGLQIHRRKSRGRRINRPRIAMVAPSRPNEVWAMDFVLDSLACGRRYRTLNVKDLFTHEVVAIEVARSITGSDVARVIDEVAEQRGYPAAIICDNGTEFTSIAMDKWSYRTKTELRFIQPGKPIQNAFIESFNAIFRNECLNRYWFADLAEAKRTIESWRCEYNRERTQKRLGKKTPEEFARSYAKLLSA
jgi:putative transposase